MHGEFISVWVIYEVRLNIIHFTHTHMDIHTHAAAAAAAAAAALTRARANTHTRMHTHAHAHLHTYAHSMHTQSLSPSVEEADIKAKINAFTEINNPGDEIVPDSLLIKFLFISSPAGAHKWHTRCTRVRRNKIN